MARKPKPLTDADRAALATFKPVPRTTTISRGDRVRIVGDHPWTGLSGVWNGTVVTPIGGTRMLEIEFDAESRRESGTTGCGAEAKYLAVERRRETLEHAQ